jgi:hypothetical protein
MPPTRDAGSSTPRSAADIVARNSLCHAARAAPDPPPASSESARSSAAAASHVPASPTASSVSATRSTMLGRTRDDRPGAGGMTGIAGGCSGGRPCSARP